MESKQNKGINGINASAPIEPEVKCDGSCEEHKGKVREVIVAGSPLMMMDVFNYCEEAIAEDMRRGFDVYVKQEDSND